MSPPDLSLLFIMACFWLTLWLVWRFLLGPIGRVLGERRRRVDDAQHVWDSTHADARTATAEIERRLEQAARTSAQLRGERRQEALAERQRTVDAARDTAERRLAAAVAELDEQTRTARAELEQHARQLSRQFASRLLEREVGS